MEKSFTSHTISVKNALGKGFLLLTFSAFFCINAMGQSTGSLVELGNLPGVNWKSLADFDQTISQENAKMDLALSPTDLQPADRALYLSYKRLMAYLQSDVQAGQKVGDVFLKRYEQVLEEAPQDPDMKYLLTGTLEGMLPGLVEALTAAPVPTKTQ